MDSRSQRLVAVSGDPQPGLSLVSRVRLRSPVQASARRTVQQREAQLRSRMSRVARAARPPVKQLELELSLVVSRWVAQQLEQADEKIPVARPAQTELLLPWAAQVG
mmetsp:Transcript_1812/g.5050  ORF Transcript_1812/g.5050 Transcript_1812/m.5050 type:complete len:107 (-) Transcript_1812:1712-2032(-)